MSMIEFKDVEKYYGDFHALKDINLDVEAGETVVLLGPSGSGKINVDSHRKWFGACSRRPINC